MSGDSNMPSSTNFDEFISVHRDELLANGVPEVFWSKLYTKLKNEIYDAGKAFSIVKQVTSDSDENSSDDADFTWSVISISEDIIHPTDGNHIYLIDHAWSYQPQYATAQLEHIPGLLERIVSIMEINTENKERSELIETVITEMWKYNQTYTLTLNPEEDPVPMWYIMDEFGVKLQHSAEPNVKVVPFFYAQKNMCFSIMWPITDIEENDEITRDYIGANITDPKIRSAKLLPWFPDVYDDETIVEEVKYDDEYFKAHSPDETLPLSGDSFIEPDRNDSMKVHTDLHGVKRFLTDERFVIVDTQDEADIIFHSQHFKDFRRLSEDHQMVNQFPNEMVLTSKDLMAITARSIKPIPKWLPTTFNMQHELPNFVSYFKSRESSGLDNHWICKPWNRSRSMDVHITDNLNCLIRLLDSGPKVAVKYIQNPVLFEWPEIGAVKFDLRFHVLMVSADPLKIYAFKSCWPRFAHKPFSMSDFGDVEKHFTVMKYFMGQNQNEIASERFIKMFEDQYTDYPWENIEEEIHGAIKQLFEAACSKSPPRGIFQYNGSRALYGVDIMLTWDTDERGHKYIQPVICEVNFSPDCVRECNFDKDFFNNVFSTLFLDDPSVTCIPV